MIDIPFQTIDWSAIPKIEHRGQTGKAFWQTVQYPGLRIRLVEYSKDYMADHWCHKGHIVHCLAGEFKSESENGESFLLKEGMTYIVSDELSSHRSTSKNGVKLMIIDGDFLMTFSRTTGSIAKTIIEIEKSALERWNRGDPSGFLEISSQDVVYFDPFTDQRLDGLENLTRLYESLRGQIKVDKYEMIKPEVKEVDNMAVLTYNLISYSDTGIEKWNCTEVYRLASRQWEIIQTHWSITRPEISFK